MPASCIFRSKLFVPGNRPDLFEKAFRSSAEALSFDLEDAVAEIQKSDARANVASFLVRKPTGFEKTVIVRVNPVGSGSFKQDVEAIVGPGLDVINIPKVESRDDILRAITIIANAERTRGLKGEIGLLANIETPKGLRLAYEIATADRRLTGLQIGFKDLLARWGIDSLNGETQLIVRLQVRLAAAEAKISAWDGAFTNIKDLDGYRAEAESARAVGFAGKTCIHPSQVPIANDVFAPRAQEIAFAENILAKAGNAASAGGGVFAIDGQMIDAPLVEEARQLLTRAKRQRSDKC